jgi:hypothetical protein
LRGRDEGDYFDTIRSDRGLFVTGDREFVDRIRDEGREHSGIIQLPQSWEREAKESVAAVLADLVSEAIKNMGSRGMDNIILIPTERGLNVVQEGKESQQMSWEVFLGVPADWDI